MIIVRTFCLHVAPATWKDNEFLSIKQKVNKDKVESLEKV